MAALHTIVRRSMIGGAIAAGLALLVAARPASRALPFTVGERLTYHVQAARVGSGRGTMWVDGPVDVRGVTTIVLHFEVAGRFGPIRAEQRSVSWIDTERFAALRFHKYQKQFLSSHDQDVELFPDERRWSTSDGASGESATDAPLDELSFIYFLRTVPLERDSLYRFDRHFDPTRNPTTVSVIGREMVTTPAGEFAAIIIEMRVKDPQQFRGDGRIRIALTDDSCRVPVRMESAMPNTGTTVLELETMSDVRCQKGE